MNGKRKWGLGVSRTKEGCERRTRSSMRVAEERRGRVGDSSTKKEKEDEEEIEEDEEGGKK